MMTAWDFITHSVSVPWWFAAYGVVSFLTLVLAGVGAAAGDR